MFRTISARQSLFDVVIAGVYFLAALPLTQAGSIAGRWTEIVAVLVFAVALGLRRRAPGIALGVAWVAALVQMAGGDTPGFMDLAVFVILYSVAAYGSRIEYWLGFASALVGALVATLYVYVGLSGQTLTLQSIPIAVIALFAAAFALLLAWTAGALVRSVLRGRATRAAQVRAEAETAAEQERVRIARDMHDVVAHSLAVVIAQADGARYAAASDPAAATEALGTISATARSALADVRLLLTQLRHAQGTGPQPALADLEALYVQVRAAGVALRIDVDPAPAADPPAAVQLAVYRILQEALTNALRHGGGAPVAVRLAWHAAALDLEVRNAVAQPRASGAPPSTGHGLIGMRERAELAGGRLDAGEADGDFVVRATIPIREDV